ncbi:MAG: hypothetical protein JF590_03250, partial [Gemmatimonadetes bacterium]|nr:hypothetical protein [Gemmatimonadota bacterium]
MSLLRRTVPMLALIGVSVGSLAAQIPINRGRPAGAATAPRMLVATPYTDRAADSAAAVTIGAALRIKFDRQVGTTFFVIPRDQMNRALAEFSYPADAILNRESAYRLATSMQSRTLLFTELNREGGQSGPFRARARFSTGADDPGNTITIRQAAGQSLQQFGEAIASAFNQVVRAQNDAKACMDQMATNPAKAAESAAKAIRTFPSHGLAHYCLAELAKGRGAADPQYVPELDLTVRGDSLSLKALGELATLFNDRSDTANVILKWQQIIEAAPTNRTLIEAASKVFRNYGRPDAAQQVADRGIALDSLDVAMWDLRSSACLFQSKYSCSVSSLEQIVTIDSTKADSNFIFRVIVTAGALFQGDSTTWADSTALKATFLKWAQLGAAKFPTNKNIIGQLPSALVVNGQSDQIPAIIDRIWALDSSDVSVLLPGVDATLKGKRWADAARYGALVSAKGDDQQKLAIAVNFTNTARGLLTVAPTDPEGAYTLLHVAAPASTDPRIVPSANLLLGYAALQTAGKYDTQAEQGKSCDIARRMDALLDESNAGFTIGKTGPGANVAQITTMMG